ncbi:hypothetical protein FEM48_Zijuj04G0078200 [Ziziphus jujuba var. spinosa]|uniref:Uncharacterized protein n=1 Tax=Ziziphus jujuba var. spinosa TaxID=714518 RepID=A0A978VIN5_ZIZJJ|nr:hypothetical protein FEM48_Zijuj04G0078200 [Ziziphus jujuba var. spinosa]
MGKYACDSSGYLDHFTSDDFDITEVYMEQTERTTLPSVKCGEVSKSEKHFHGETSSPVGCPTVSLNIQASLLPDPSTTEKCVENFCKRKKKKNTKKKQKKKRESAKMLYDEIVSEAGRRVCTTDDLMTSYHSSKADVENPALHCEAGKCRKNGFSYPGITSPSVLNVTSDQNCEKLPKVSHVGFPGCNRTCVPANFKSCNGGCGTENIYKNLNTSKRGPNEVSTNSISEKLQGSEFSRHADCSKVGDCRYKNTKTSRCCYIVYNVHDNFASHSCAIKEIVRCSHNVKGSRHFVWQKKNASSAELRGKSYSYHSFYGHGCLPGPLVCSSVSNAAAHGTNRMRHVEPFMYGRRWSRVLKEQPQSAGQQVLNWDLKRHFSSTCHLCDWGSRSGKSKADLTNSLTHEKYDRKRDTGAKFFELYDKDAISQKHLSHIPLKLPHYKSRYTARNFYGSQHIEGLPNGSQLYNLRKIPSREHVCHRSSCVSLQSKPCSEFEFHRNIEFRQNFTSGAAIWKWIPVVKGQRKLTERTGSAGMCNEFKDNFLVLHDRINDSPLEGNKIPISSSAAACDPESTSSISSQKTSSVENANQNLYHADAARGHEDECQFNKAPARRLKDAHQISIGSQVAWEALNTAYKELASKDIRLSTECSLAQVETLLHSAAPIISYSTGHKRCDICSCNSFLCEYHIPNLPLRAVWNWYEKPGKYGLAIKVENSTNLNAIQTDSISFHFVPYLSAVQLFGYPELSKRCGRKKEVIDGDIYDGGEGIGPENSCSRMLPRHTSEAMVELNHCEAGDKNFAMNFELVKEPFIASNIVAVNGSEVLDSCLLASPTDSKLIFEFFESELPQHRKPFYDKILELIDVKTSNRGEYQICYGDPSKLDCMNLQELHPASWFSVAWYPIYRIPEGKFHASFLTYHSLGHLVQRHILGDSQEKDISCIVSPVLGLESYNTQGECWFDPKISSDIFNGSAILKERLETLEANASLFARGLGWKDNVMEYNKQPDYEFFISRKANVD